MTTPKMPKILIVSTGGTIAALPNERGSLAMSPFSKDRLLKTLPEISQIADIDVLPLMMMDSVNMEPEHWVIIGKAIHEQIGKYRGFVVLHGLDTMAFTASALSLMFHGLTVPIVLTGATTPLEYISSDAEPNLIGAIQVAAQSDLAEVSIVSDGRIFRGSRVKKVQEIDFSTFESAIVPPLGVIKGNPILTNSYFKRGQSKQHTFDPKFCTDVVALMAYPGFDPRILEQVLNLNPLGLVMVGYGSGCLPVQGKSSVLPALEKFTQQKGHVLVATQVTFGQCWMDAHEVGSKLVDVGAISAQDMTYETAIVKLMWILGHTQKREEIIDMMHSCYAGEVAPQIMLGGEDFFGVKR